MTDLLFISNAWAQEATAPTGGSPLSSLILIGGMFFIFYVLLIMPQKKHEKKRQEMINSLEKGDEVVTQAGIYGKVVGVAEKVITLEVSPNVKIKISRQAIAGFAEEKAA
ncbi:MAG: preprotein translocase subunit YajC [Deltaproteobacteria bacterium]|nr:preprotein translocase subunit YajC [Deltaproteobacteria bacterium]